MDGNEEIAIGENKPRLTKGQSIVVPAGMPNGLEAPEPFIMLLAAVFQS